MIHTRLSLSIFAALLASPLLSIAAEPTAPATQAATTQPERHRIISPVVGADRRITFRLDAPHATTVTVIGLFGKLPMARGNDGIWTATTEALDPEVYEYRYSVDGLQVLDPANPNIKSQLDSFVEVPAAEPALYDNCPVPHGQVRMQWYASKSLGVNRRMHVYLPPGYDTATATRYPVLYLLHGSGDDDSGWVTTGRANFIFDNLLAAKKMVPMIVVMPYGHTPASPGPGLATAPVGAPDPALAFQRDLLEDVIPLVESSYRVQADAAHRAVAGLSMGGGQSLRLALTHADLFTYVVLMSQGFRGMDNLDAAFPDVPSDAQSIGSHFKLFWIGGGRKDRLFKGSQRLDQWLTAHRIAHEFHEGDGAHDWRVWRGNLIEVTPRLFQEN
jgi:enterochelin esterase family protein